MQRLGLGSDPVLRDAPNKGHQARAGRSVGLAARSTSTVKNTNAVIGFAPYGRSLVDRQACKREA